MELNEDFSVYYENVETSVHGLIRWAIKVSDDSEQLMTYVYDDHLAVLTDVMQFVIQASMSEDGVNFPQLLSYFENMRATLENENIIRVDAGSSSIQVLLVDIEAAVLSLQRTTVLL